MTGFTPSDLLGQYQQVRNFTEKLCIPLETEDFVVQSMPDVSPTKWHLAHTTWFFETFILKPSSTNYRPFNEQFEYLFNSYYNGIGEQFPRPHRGLLTRPTVKQVFEYRDYVDNAMVQWMNQPTGPANADTLLLGLNHEQQHQELMLTDIKHVFSINPTYPVYKESRFNESGSLTPISWHDFQGGAFEIGFTEQSFHYDNEGPVHQQIVPSFQLANRLVSNQDYLEFIEDDGYKRPELWLSEGWSWLTKHQLSHPFYWRMQDGTFLEFTLQGLKNLDLSAPVSHLSLFEADAFARWANARLPTEFEWEVASKQVGIEGNFANNEIFNPIAHADPSNKLQQMFGDVWEWTSSSYSPYPGFKPADGAIGEYNGKFMCNQYVLRGGSCATSLDHIRHTYRNFFPADARWQFSGLRLARDL